MIGNTIKKALGLTVSAAIISFCVPFSASAADNEKKGRVGQFDYMMWNKDNTGEVTFEPGEGTFTCSWENVDNCLFSMGKKYERIQNYKTLPSYERSLAYEAEYYPKGNSFIGVHGWTTNPLLEFYIVEGYGERVLPTNIEDRGSYYIDNKTYDLYKQMVYNHPSIEGTATFPVYWSVCTESCAKNNQKNYIRDNVDFYGHFKLMEQLGADMYGNLNEVSLYIENYKSSGSANVKKVYMSSSSSGISQILRYGPYVSNPRLSFADIDGYYYIYNFDSDQIIDWSSYDECDLSVSENGYLDINGDNSILVSDRAEAWDGAVLPVSNNFSSGDTLSFGAAVKQDTEESVDFILTVMYEDEEGITQFDEAAVVSANKGEWADLSTTAYTIPEKAYNTTIRIETKESNTDFYFDNAYVAKAGVRSYMNKLIEEESDLECEKGDINKDGIVDVFDIISLRRIILDLTAGDGSYLHRADVNSDGMVNVADLVRLQRFILCAEKLYDTETAAVTTTTAALTGSSSTYTTTFTTTENTSQVTASQTEPASYNHISQEKAKEMMAADDSLVIVDVRRQDEYDSGHIPGAILIPNESIDMEQPEELPDKEQVILIYCRSGNRSKAASQKLADMGYTNIYEFGGIMDWSGEIATS
ncbi:glycoside hydrolase family 11 protein [Ruminococcus flavefaciens]|uniref:glycoside hydrolase family 11 protein n=1 Tax=Ruminococcus flavefaciens TaxID=1265 RepID=UPI0026EAD5D0|nr:glycoside hydrolase family 11 protein [Ruminococcus flavefaciens]MDD7517677.1 glycoside hydrolase family 11 protein [Ruminococcus flavefaciens]MDY5693014.1 glycoside hydrolase family 11 protein [Ruminococcus flavefaciens]